VTLTSPTGTSVTLHNRSGGTSDNLIGNWPEDLFVDGVGELADFVGEAAIGTWTFHVFDQQFGALGTFNSWSLNLLLEATDVSPVSNDSPFVTRLVGNSPNPFNPQTHIIFELAKPAKVQLEVFDLRGRLVRRLADQSFGSGRHNVLWDGRNESGGGTASGLYFYRLTTDDERETKKMLLVR